jgi:drug/metabolite transporter (DMT)-like permease
MNWISYAVGAAVALAAADFFLKLAAGKLSNSLGLLIYGSCTFIAGLSWVLLDKIRGVGLHAQTAGVVSATGVGVSFSLVTMCLYLTFGAGAPVSLGAPFIRLVGLIIVSLAGLFILHEPLTWRYAIGMILAISGVFLIITR